MQRDRRRDPYPWTWEIPASVIGTTLLVAVIGIQLGRALANLLAGAGWTWPDTATGAVASPLGTAFWTSLPGVLRGDSAAGLPITADRDVAGPVLLGTCLLLTEAALLTAAILVGNYLYRRGPGRMRGMATTAEAEKLLGVTRLRKAAAIVRPDLYGKSPQRPVPPRNAGADDTNIDIGRGLSPWLLNGRSDTRSGDRTR